MEDTETTEVVSSGIETEQPVEATTEEKVAETPATPPAIAPDASVGQFDVNALKASMQRREEMLKQQWQEQAAALERDRAMMRQKLYEYETAGLDETAKAAYDAQWKMREYEARLQQSQQQIQSLQAQMQAEQTAKARREGYVNFFAGLGIPKEYLEKHADEGPEALVAAVQAHFKGLNAKASQSPPQAPQVAKSVPGRTTGGLLSKLDTMSPAEREEVWRRASAGLIRDNEL